MEEEWKSLNGCNACVNSAACEHLHSCFILVIDNKIPHSNKRKKRVITRVRSLGDGITAEDMSSVIQEIDRMVDVGRQIREEKKSYRTWGGTVRLTRLEEMFIDNLNKPR